MVGFETVQYEAFAGRWGMKLDSTWIRACASSQMGEGVLLQPPTPMLSHLGTLGSDITSECVHLGVFNDKLNKHASGLGVMCVVAFLTLTCLFNIE